MRKSLVSLKRHIGELLSDIYIIEFLLFNIKFASTKYPMFVFDKSQYTLGYINEKENKSLFISAKFFKTIHFWFIIFVDKFALYFGKLLFII
jgi:hypothetical protein